MSAQIFKMVGVKNKKQFDKLFPDTPEGEKAFLAKYGKQLRKAQMGAYIGGEKTSNPQMMNFDDYYNAADKQITGTNNPERQQQAYQQQMLAAQQNQKGGGLGDIMGMVSQGMEMFGEEGGAESGAEGIAAMAARNGRNIPKAQPGGQFQMNSNMNYPGTGFSGTGQRPQVNNISTQQIGVNQPMATGGGANGGPLGVDVPKGEGVMGAIGKYAGPAGDLIEGFQMLKAEKEALKGAKQWKGVSDLTLQASASRPEETQRRYTRPEDIQNTGEEFFPIYGVGTNALAKNGGEIQNTYAPNNLYKDLGYEPRKAEGGAAMSPDMYGQIGGMATNMSQSLMGGQNAGGKIGGTLGKTAGQAIGGPVGGMIGEFVGGTAGQLLDKNVKRKERLQKQTQRNMQGMAVNQLGQGVQQQYSSFVEHGGSIPYRTGGNIRQNNMDELQVYEGEAEQISTNPYLPDGGETVMFRGPSHDDGGMDISYGNSPVEVEGGEPAVKLQNGGEEENLVIYGNLQIPKGMLQDPDAKNKKFKNYVNLLSKKEEKQNKIADKSTKELSEFKPITSFDKLKLASLEANLKGTDMKLKDLAEKKIDAAALQNAINDTAKEQGLVADDLAKGKYKVDRKAMNSQAKFGKSIALDGDNSSAIEDPIGVVSKADHAYLVDLYEKAKNSPDRRGPAVEKFQREFSRIAPNKAKQVLEKFGVTNYGKNKGLKATDLESNYDQIFGDRTEAYRSSLGDPLMETSPIATSNISDTSVKDKTIAKTTAEETTKSRFPWMQYANQALEYLRPTDQEALDPNQLAGEMYSMMNNQLEPVPAQGYRPQLDVPYDISLQDQLNEVTAQSREAMRMAGGNPAMAAMIAGQAYDPKSKILAEQFRMNQGKKDQVYSQNRATMNDAQLKNLEIYDQQYGRQAQAKANTKEATQLALNSMSDKFAKNKLENRQLGVYENLYKYRFDDKGRAMNMNPFVDFNERIANASQNPQMGMSDAEQELNLRDQADVLKAKRTEQKKREKETAISRNGSIVKALRNY